VTVFLVVAAALFAVVAGANDGSSILAAGLQVPGMRPWVAIMVLLAALVIGPVLFGTGVATTLAHGLVPFGGDRADRAALLCAVCSAIAVVLCLTRVGLSTSLTLALIGAITGAGVGAGLPISGSTLLEIVVFGIAAPLLAGVMAFGVAPLILRVLASPHMTRRTIRVHIVAFSLQCMAYSANGGQKMLAVFAIAVGTGSAAVVEDPWWVALLLASLFAIGILIGIRRISASLGGGIMAVHLRHALVAETCSFAVVMGAGLLGVPLTMTQSVAGALVGVGASEAASRIRWSVATRFIGAWAVTLPVSFGVAALAALVVHSA